MDIVQVPEDTAAFPGSDHTHGSVCRLEHEIVRRRDDVSDIEARLDTSDDGAPAWTWKPIELSNEERLVRLVGDGVETGAEAAEELGLTKGAISKIKRRLVKKGILASGSGFQRIDE